MLDLIVGNRPLVWGQNGRLPRAERRRAKEAIGLTSSTSWETSAARKQTFSLPKA